MIKNGAPVYPWPKNQNPSDHWKRKKLVKMGMHEWVDKSGHSTWINIPQTEQNSEDSDEDVPEEADGKLFGISKANDTSGTDTDESI
jgi:hypothetical protein